MDRWDQARAEDAVDWSAMSDVVRALRKVAKWPLMQGFENVRPESYNGELFLFTDNVLVLEHGS